MLTLQNPAGFGPGDVIELVLAGLLLAIAIIARPFVEPYASRLSRRGRWSMLLLAALPVALRLAMLAQHSVPAPHVYDEFGHLLVADTLRHFRLANPAHPLHQFFETFFVLQTPAYASIYPLGQGISLAIGRALFGIPWVGVLLSTAAMCALCYWMLRGWTSPEWALLGGVLAVIEFGPLSGWMNSYWGGSLVGAAGCLVFGALPRLRDRARVRDGLLLGLGLGMHWLTRPYETVFLALAALLFFAHGLKLKDARLLAKPAMAAGLIVLPALGLSLAQNKEITGSWTTLPYMLSRYQYGVPAAFTWQPNPAPHLELTHEQQLQHKMQTSFRAGGPETIATYFQRLEYRIRFYRFFFLAPLYLALPFFLLRLREWRFAWVALTLLIFALGVNFYPFFEVHYLGALTCLFVLVSVAGLERLSALSSEAARLIIFLCIAQFLFLYGKSFFDAPGPDARRAVLRQLSQTPGNQLVFVRYGPHHIFQNEWVYNDADIDRAPVVWARDLGAEDEKLREYYPRRTAWLLDADATPPQLSPYRAAAAEPAPKPPTPPPDNGPGLRFEQVH